MYNDFDREEMYGDEPVCPNCNDEGCRFCCSEDAPEDRDFGDFADFDDDGYDDDDYNGDNEDYGYGSYDDFDDGRYDE